MPLRVNPNPSTDFFAELQIVRQQQNQALQQLASGSRINAPSDDPSGAASLLENQAQADQVDQFQKNVQDLQPQLQAADSALSSAVSALTQAISLGVEGGNSTLSPSELQSLAQQVSGIRSEILGIANTSVQGQFIFAGTLTDTAPYVLDGASPSGVDYVGNSGVNKIELSNGQTAAINMPGSQLFSNPAGDVFGALNQLINALQSGTGIPAATVALGQAFSVLSNQRTFYGTTLNEFNNSEAFLSNESVQLSSQASQISSADLAKVVTNLTQAETANAALLSAQGKILSQSTLFDFLP
jgi:flagellar hook-associated protein 3 FlgL